MGCISGCESLRNATMKLLCLDNLRVGKEASLGKLHVPLSSCLCMPRKHEA